MAYADAKGTVKPKVREIDYASIGRKLDGLEAESVAEAVGAIKTARDGLIDRVRNEFRSNTTSADWVGKLEIRAWGAVRTALREMAGAGYAQGRLDLRREAKRASEFRVTVTPREAARFMDERMFWVSGVLREDLTKRAQTILMQAIKHGEGLDETVEKLGDVFEPYVGADVEPGVIRPARLETIVRTNLTEAYNTARLAEIHDPEVAPFVEGVRYSAILDSRTTEICEFLHGKVFRADDEDLDRLAPPNHFNCRSLLVPVIVGEEIDEFASQDEIDEALEMIAEGFGGDRKTFTAKEVAR